MIKKIRPQKSEIENILYPLKSIEESNKYSKKFQQDNYNKIQSIQKNVKAKAIELENKHESVWKMNKFKNVKSKIRSQSTQKSNETIEKKIESNINYNSKSKSKPKPIDSLSKRKTSSKITNENINLHNKEEKPQDPNEKIEEMLVKGKPLKIEDSLSNPKQIAFGKNEISKEGEICDSKNLAKKPPVPKAIEINKLAPRLEKNFLQDNFKKNIEAAPKNVKTIELEDAKTLNPIYGKVPKYIEEFKKKVDEQKENLKKEEELKKIPPGTRLLPEEERIETLENLKSSKAEILKVLGKMPIAIKTIKMAKKKEEMEKKIDDLDKAIETFSKKNVYVSNN